MLATGKTEVSGEGAARDYIEETGNSHSGEGGTKEPQRIPHPPA